MNDFLNVLKNHWETIVAVFLFILSFILQLIKKKPVKLIDGIKTFISEAVPAIVNTAESLYGSGHGDDKKKYVHELICSMIGSRYGIQPRKVDDLYEEYIDDTIELVLSTPQKKEK